eukprot:1084576-Pyramimonas_sp.AAC.1
MWTRYRGASRNQCDDHNKTGKAFHLLVERYGPMFVVAHRIWMGWRGCETLPRLHGVLTLGGQCQFTSSTRAALTPYLPQG